MKKKSCWGWRRFLFGKHRICGCRKRGRGLIYDPEEVGYKRVIARFVRIHNDGSNYLNGIDGKE